MIKLIEQRILKIDKLTIENLSFLDFTLEILINETEQLRLDKLKIKLRERIKKNRIDSIIYDPLKKLENAISYLEELEMIQIYRSASMIPYKPDQVVITFKGILKQSKGGFVGEYKQLKMRNFSSYFFQILMPIVTILAIFTSVILAIFK